MVSDPPRPSVVMSFVSWLTPWNPATIARVPSSGAVRMRPGGASMLRAVWWSESVAVVRPSWSPPRGC